jgi:hypothetical protein
VLAWIQKLAEDFNGHLTDPELDPRLRTRYSREVRGVLRDVAVTQSVPDPAATVSTEEKITRSRGCAEGIATGFLAIPLVSGTI